MRLPAARAVIADHHAVAGPDCRPHPPGETYAADGRKQTQAVAAGPE